MLVSGVRHNDLRFVDTVRHNDLHFVDTVKCVQFHNMKFCDICPCKSSFTSGTIHS